MFNDLTSDFADIGVLRDSKRYVRAAAVQELFAAFSLVGVVWTDLNRDLDLRIADDVRALIQSSHFDRYRPITECGTGCLATIVSAIAVSSESSCAIGPREQNRIACAIIDVATTFYMKLEWEMP